MKTLSVYIHIPFCVQKCFKQVEKCRGEYILPPVCHFVNRANCVCPL